MSNEATAPLQACLAETIASQHPVLKITRLFSTGQYEHVKYEVEIPLPNGGMGQALLDIDYALTLLNPASMPHDEEQQNEYLAMQGTERATPLHVNRIEHYEQWKRDEQRGKEILDFYTKPQAPVAAQNKAWQLLDPRLIEENGCYYFDGKKISNFTVEKITIALETRYLFRVQTKQGVYGSSEMVRSALTSSMNFRAYVAGLGEFHWFGGQDAVDALTCMLDESDATEQTTQPTTPNAQ